MKTTAQTNYEVTLDTVGRIPDFAGFLLGKLQYAYLRAEPAVAVWAQEILAEAAQLGYVEATERADHGVHRYPDSDTRDFTAYELVCRTSGTTRLIGLHRTAYDAEGNVSLGSGDATFRCSSCGENVTIPQD